MAKEGGVVGAQWCAPGDREVTLLLCQPACSSMAHVYRNSDAESSQPLFDIFNPPCVYYGRHNQVLSVDNSPVLCSYQKFFSGKKTTSVYRGGSRRAEGSSLLFTARLSKVIQLSINMDVFLKTPADGSLPASNNINHRAPDYRVKASCISNHLTITRSDGVIVAKAHHKFSFSSFFLCKPYYKIVVYPGVDQALIAMLVAIQDKLRTSIYGNINGGPLIVN